MTFPWATIGNSVIPAMSLPTPLQTDWRAPCRLGSVCKALIVTVIGLVSGCGAKEEEEPPNVEVQGKVILQGSAGDYFIVTFTSQGSKRENRFQSQAFKAGQSFTVQCPAGTYKATIATVTTQNNAGGPVTVGPGKAGGIPTKYRNPFESPWKVEVPGGARKAWCLKSIRSLSEKGVGPLNNHRV